MKLIINHQETESKAATLLQLAKELTLPARGVAVAVNNRMIPRIEWAEQTLAESDKITIIKAACGG